MQQLLVIVLDYALKNGSSSLHNAIDFNIERLSTKAHEINTQNLAAHNNYWTRPTLETSY